MYVYLKYYLKHFLLYGCLLIQFRIIVTFLGSYTFTLKEAIVLISIGTIATLATGSLHILAVKNVPNAKLEEALRVSQRRSVEVALESHDAFYESLDYLQTALQCKIEADLANGEIKARTGLSWASWGEIVTLLFRNKGPKLTSIEITSRPWLGTAWMDDGRNYRNVEEVARYLDRFSPRSRFLIVAE